MGIKAPTNSDYMVAVFTSLVSYNRPVILFAVFVISFIVVYFLTKKAIISLIISICLTFVTASYFVISYLSALRY